MGAATKSIPHAKHFVLPVFQALRELDGAARKKEVIEKILQNEGISERFKYVTSTGRVRVNRLVIRNIGFACTCLKVNGFVTYPRTGFWSLTETGRVIGQINPDKLWGNYERIRNTRTERQQVVIDDRSTGPVKIYSKEELLQPVIDALHALDGSGTAFEISQQTIILEQLIAPSLLEDNFLENSERARRLHNNIASARTALKKAGLIFNRGGKWLLKKNILPSFVVDPRTVQRAEIVTAASRKAAKAAEIDKAVSQAVTEIRDEIKEETKQFAKSIRNELEQNLRHESAAREDSGSTPLETNTESPAEHESKEIHSPPPLEDFLFYLQNLLYTRHADRPPNHYTTNLFNAGLSAITDKIAEESAEVVEAALHETRERQISEVADLLVHTLILLAELNIPLEEVLAELQRRHEARTS